jgi:PAS domain S-box-containing protein
VPGAVSIYDTRGPVKPSRPLTAVTALGARNAEVASVLDDHELSSRQVEGVSALRDLLEREVVDVVLTDADIEDLTLIGRKLRSQTSTTLSLLLWVSEDRDEARLDEATRVGVDHALHPTTLRAELRQILLAHRRRGWVAGSADRAVEPGIGDVWAILDAIPAPVFYKDTQGRYLGCNQAFEQFIGTTRAKLAGQTVYELSPAHLADKYFEADNALFASGGTQVYEARVRRADAEERDVIFYKALFSTENVNGLVGTLLDISDRKELERQLAGERERSEELLRNILPDAIAARLKDQTSEERVAESFSGVTVVFADIVDFTQLSATMSSERLVAMLDEVFSCFDRIADSHGIEKIKTIGDCYMVASGLPEPRTDHARAAAEFSLDLRACLGDLGRRVGHPLRLRIGMNSGPVTAGVIGRKKFIYDLWGDVVNTASRMEAHGVPDEIHCTDRTRQLLTETFELEHRGEIEVKGKGPMTTWFLRDRVVAR